MRARQDPPPELLALAGCQGGVVTSEQVRAFGLGPNAVTRLLQTRRWRRLDKGLYLVHDIEPVWTARAWGGVLLGGQDARLGGRSAAFGWELVEEPDLVTVLVPHRRSVDDREGWEFRRERPGVREARSWGDPPRTGVVDTVLDLCDEVDADRAVSLVLKAVQSRRTKPDRLVRALRDRGRARHRRLLTDVLADAQEGAETPLELRYLRDVERAHGLPRGRRQARAGWSRHVRDVRYDEYALVVELDGHLGHEDMGRFRDMNRDNLATLHDETTLRYGWTDVTGRPCRVASQVSTICIRRGWPGTPHRCPHCWKVPDQEWAE